MAKSKLYEPASHEPFKLSRNRVEEHLRCARCFVLTNKYGLKKPSSPPFTLNSAVDSLLKNEFDLHRAAGTVHPIVAAAGLDLVPFQHPDIDTWRSNFKGISYLHEATNLLLTGAVDDVWVTREGELVVVDYKATAKAEPMTSVPEGGFYDSYRRQLDFYQWLFRMNGFKVSKTSYWLYCTGRPGDASFNQVLNFECHLIPYVSDDSWIEPELQQIVQDLNYIGLPEASESCDFCAYAEARHDVESAHDRDAFPTCPRCRQRMSRVRYGLPDGPPPAFTVDGGCIIGPDMPQFVCTFCSELGL